MRKIIIEHDSQDLSCARIGGGAFIGGVLNWPQTNDGRNLTLVTSIPLEIISSISTQEHTDRARFISVFSYYSDKDYFIDNITYHGSMDELDYINTHQTTKVLVHEKGELVQNGHSVRPMLIEIDNHDEVGCFQGSGFGMPPGFIQNENIDFTDKIFILQLYSNDFPEPFKDIFGLSDAVGYLYLNRNRDGGLFFVQSS